jgi:hypothetical protein
LQLPGLVVAIRRGGLSNTLSQRAFCLLNLPSGANG